MYERFEKILRKKGLTAYYVHKMTGISTTTLTKWKQGAYVPKIDKMQKIADLLGVSADYLYGKSEQPYPMVEDIINDSPVLRAAVKNDGRIANEFMISTLIDTIRPTNFELNIILAYRSASESRKEMVRLALDMQDEYEIEKKDGNIKEGTR